MKKVKEEIQEAEVIEESQDSKLSIVNKGELSLVVPQELTIEGVVVSNAKIKEKVAEILKMKIDGISDKKGYDAAVKAKGECVKMRTLPEKWRKKSIANLSKFLTDLKATTDGFGAEAKVGEDHLAKIIKVYEDGKEAEKTRLAEEKQKVTNERIGKLIACGGVLDGYNYKFALSPALQISVLAISEWDEKEFDELYDEVKSDFDTEQTRIANQATKLAEDTLKLNEKRTALRIKELTLNGYESDENGNYAGISKDNILNWEDEEWDALFAPVEETVESDTEVPVKKETRSGGGYTPSFGTSLPPKIDIEEKEGNVSIVNIKFSDSLPFIEVQVGEFTQRFYPTNNEDIANTVDAEFVAISGEVTEDLRFIMYKV
jgi:hypothetical protein